MQYNINVCIYFKIYMYTVGVYPADGVVVVSVFNVSGACTSNSKFVLLRDCITTNDNATPPRLNTVYKMK